MPVPENLRAVADQIRESGEPHVDTVRTLLSWFGQQRRGRAVVGTVRAGLREAGLTTEPNFETAYIDGSLVFTLEVGPEAPSTDGAVDTAESSDTPIAAFEDPVARIRMLPAANRPPVSVTRDATVAEAVTLMLMNDFSQLPVMQNERDVSGLVSWRSIGRARVRNDPCQVVRDCMEPVSDMGQDTPLLEAIATVAREEVVLIRDDGRRVTGIVTTSDLSLQFRELAEPFLLLGEIENQIRRLIDGCFSAEELAAARHPDDEEREVEGVADLTFGEYVRLLENTSHWSRLELDLDRRQFVAQLQRVRRIRNEVMHFSPDGTSPEDLECLRDTVRFLQQIH